MADSTYEKLEAGSWLFSGDPTCFAYIQRLCQEHSGTASDAALQNVIIPRLMWSSNTPTERLNIEVKQQVEGGTSGDI